MLFPVFAHVLGILVDSEIVLSTRYGKTRVFINKTLSTETDYQQDLINRDLLSTSLIVGKVGSGMSRVELKIIVFSPSFVLHYINEVDSW